MHRDRGALGELLGPSPRESPRDQQIPDHLDPDLADPGEIEPRDRDPDPVDLEDLISWARRIQRHPELGTASTIAPVGQPEDLVGVGGEQALERGPGWLGDLHGILYPAGLIPWPRDEPGRGMSPAAG